tara:strand:+ start:505 stop:1029 length:525 start_codon:yes stop_codon:yes gene_type:complete
MKIKFIKFIIFFIIFFVLSIFFVSLNKDPLYSTKDLEGEKIQDISLNHFSKNEIISNQDLKKNKFTLINFWASWCAPCRLEHPYLVKLNKEDNLKILGVNFKDKKQNAIKFLNDFGNPYDYLAKDTTGKQSVNFGIYGIPESILINKDLIIVKKFIGPLTYNDYIKIRGAVKNE